MNWKYWLILIISVIILIIAPGLFTQTAIFDFWKFDQVTGSVGDTIGGTTAPIVGLISIFLLVVTLWEQKKSNESQLKYMRDEKFESTFFNLLNEQREIQKTLRARFWGLARNNVTKTVEKYVFAQEIFSMAHYELDILFKSFDKDDYIHGYDSDEISEILESVYDEMYVGMNLPQELEEENAAALAEVQTNALCAYFNDLYKVSNADFLRYKSLSAEQKIAFVYSKFFKRRDNCGHYFRHLYRIMAFVQYCEEKELKASNPKNTNEVRDKYKMYAQFIQAQMSSEELLMLFYNSFCFPKTKELIIKYNLLENLNIENLIKPEHNCIEGFALKHRI